MRTFLAALALGAVLIPTSANAWWNKDWMQRTRITLNTSAQGVQTKEAVTALSVAVRLHSGNFDFAAAKEDGSDLRVVAGDDKTPLKFSVERFDGLNELAMLWVQVPTVAAGSAANVFYVYAGNAKAANEAAVGAGFDPATVAAFHFSDAKVAGADHAGAFAVDTPVLTETNGLLGGSAKLDGKALVWRAVDKLKIDAAGSMTITLWVKPEAVASGTVLQWGGVGISLQDGKAAARIDKATLAGGDIAAGAWTQLGLTVGGGKAMLYVNGAMVAQADAALPVLNTAATPLQVGDGVKGLADELQISNIVRSPDWLRVSAGAQGAEGKLVAALKETTDTVEGGSPNYLAVLVKNLTLDAWIVMVILGVMFVVAMWVMAVKAIFVSKVDKGNRGFLQRFRGASTNLLGLEQGAAHPNSPLFRLYQAGTRELNKRNVGKENSAPLSGASIDAVKASVDADLVRESHRLNSQMVLLTIAISGGPFLGLLGTVVGVMITFAAIAAAGDVNVNAIAPGIAAALLCTVAGLAVAIPALFGYNYLAARIKNISSDMQIFVDEFITRVAEVYGAR